MIGFFKLRERFLKAIRNNTLSHAHIVVGPDGIGKSAFVETIAREILGFGNRDSVDIVRIRPEKTIITVNQIREVVVEASLRPYEGYKKVIILYEANKMGQEAQNALLKTIEEPLDGVYFFLLAENDMFLTDTIKSRCHLHKLLPLDDAEMKQYAITFQENFNEQEVGRVRDEQLQKEASNSKNKIEPLRHIQLTMEDIEQVVSMSRGIPGKAEQIILNEMKDDTLNLTVSLLKSLAETKRSRSREHYKVLNLAGDLSSRDLSQVFDDFSYTVDCILKEKSLYEQPIKEVGLKEEIEYFSRELTFSTLEKYLDIFFEMRKYIMQGININKETIVSSLLLKLMEV